MSSIIPPNQQSYVRPDVARDAHRATLSGNPQYSSVSHGNNSARLAVALNRSGEYSGVYMNRQLSTIVEHVNQAYGTNVPTDFAGSRNRFDVTTVSRSANGQVSIVGHEILSPGDIRSNATRNHVLSRNASSLEFLNAHGIRATASTPIEPGRLITTNYLQNNSYLGSRGGTAIAAAGEGVFVTPSGGFQWGTAGRVAGRALIIGGVSQSLYNIYTAEDRYHAVARESGGWAGAYAGGWAGTQAGAWVGSFGGPVGSAIGGFVGGIVGGVAGFIGGCSGADAMYGGIDLSLTLTLEDNIFDIEKIMYHPQHGQIMFGGIGNAPVDKRLLGSLALEDFAFALKCVYFDGKEPSFSLDANDSLDPFGPYQKKVYYPSTMEGTYFGVVLFEADYLLKELSMGRKTLPDGTIVDRSSSEVLPGWLNEFEIQGTHTEQMHRMWIVVDKVEVLRNKQRDDDTESPLGFSIGNIQLGVLCSALETDPTSSTGVRDRQITDINSSACLFAVQATRRMPELIARFSELQRLVDCVRVTALAKVMQYLNLPIEKAWLEYIISRPFVKEEKRLVPTMQATRETVTTTAIVDGTSTTNTHRQCLRGGCELTMKVGRHIIFTDTVDTSEKATAWFTLLQDPHRKDTIPVEYTPPGRTLGSEYQYLPINPQSKNDSCVELAIPQGKRLGYHIDNTAAAIPFGLTLPFARRAIPRPAAPSAASTGTTSHTSYEKKYIGECMACGIKIVEGQATACSRDGRILCSLLRCLQSAQPLQDAATSNHPRKQKNLWESVCFMTKPACMICQESIEGTSHGFMASSECPLMVYHEKCRTCSYPNCGVHDATCELIVKSALTFIPVFGGEMYAFCCSQHYPRDYNSSSGIVDQDNRDDEVSSNNLLWEDMIRSQSSLEASFFPGKRYTLQNESQSLPSSSTGKSNGGSSGGGIGSAIISADTKRDLQRQAALQRLSAIMPPTPPASGVTSAINKKNSTTVTSSMTTLGKSSASTTNKASSTVKEQPTAAVAAEKRSVDREDEDLQRAIELSNASSASATYTQQEDEELRRAIELSKATSSHKSSTLAATTSRATTTAIIEDEEQQYQLALLQSLQEQHQTMLAMNIVEENELEKALRLSMSIARGSITLLPAEQEWSCRACTVLNHPMLRICSVCETPKN